MHGPGAVRSGKWKFYPWKEGKGGKRHEKANNPSPDPVQLYDTLADIGETKNLASQYPNIVKQMQFAYDSHLVEIKANKRPTQEMKRPKNKPAATRPFIKKKKK